MKKIFFWAALAAVLPGCTVHVKGPQNALVPDGEQVLFTPAGGVPREGELVEITENRVIVREKDRFVAIGFTELQKVEVIRYGFSVEKDWQKKLKLYSRYPQGLTEEQWRQVLGEAGQKDFLGSGTLPEGKAPGNNQ